MNNNTYEAGLSAPQKAQRLEALKQLKNKISSEVERTGYTNNHVHSTYSFSPYSPSAIVHEAYKAGLSIVGIMDHDSMAGAEEFIEAGRIMGVAATVGFELRTDWKDTPFGDLRINNPDQKGCGYICIHGVPHQNIEKAEEFLESIRDARNLRNKKMTDNINALVKDVKLDFEKDVMPISMAAEGGSITERHILYALGIKLVEEYEKGQGLLDYLEDELKIQLSQKQKSYLSDAQSSEYYYDLLNILKSNFVGKVYEDAGYPEIQPVKSVVEFAKEIGAIPAYAYLGDVGLSATGDKKAQKFEDDYIDELMKFVKNTGFEAVAYMPSRNTLPQLTKLQKLCVKHDLFQISGEDINQPRQSFICAQLKDEDFIHLQGSAWALVGHETASEHGTEEGMFGSKNKGLNLGEKIEKFKDIGLDNAEF